MQIMITHSGLSRSRVLQFNRLQMAGMLAALVVVLTLLSGTVYHFIFLKAAREGWPVVSQIVRLVVRDEFAQRDRYMRDNLDAMATQAGEMKAKLIKLEAISERVSGMAGVKADELKQLRQPANGKGGAGGPYVPAQPQPSLEALSTFVGQLDARIDLETDVFTMIESRLFEKRLDAAMVPNSRPVDGPVGSGFGFRSDPFTARSALHTGLDFPAETGTPIQAAAGGVVLSTDMHPAYGHLVEVDHGKGLVTRYAHTSAVLVKAGDIVKRGQLIARVGSTGRSTGPHLHFEVLVDGVQQDPARFLAGGASGSASGGASSAQAGREVAVGKP